MMGMGIPGSCHSFPVLTSTFWSGLFLDLGFTYWKHRQRQPRPPCGQAAGEGHQGEVAPLGVLSACLWLVSWDAFSMNSLPILPEGPRRTCPRSPGLLSSEAGKAGSLPTYLCIVLFLHNYPGPSCSPHTLRAVGRDCKSHFSSGTLKGRVPCALEKGACGIHSERQGVGPGFLASCLYLIRFFYTTLLTPCVCICV